MLNNIFKSYNFLKGIPMNSYGKLENNDFNALSRALYKCIGYTDDDLKRPLIGIVNTWNTACPGQYNLKMVSEHVKNGIYRAGGTPVEFGTIGPCDGIAQGKEGMNYILPSRDIIAHSIEIMTMSYRFDGIVLLGSCDKIVPALLMAAARIDIPSIILNGGHMLPGRFNNKNIDVNQISIGLGAYRSGKLTKEEYKELEDEACPGPGSCQMMGTANTMCAISEALGMTLPGVSSIPAVDSSRLRAAQETGKQIMTLVNSSVTARDIMTEESVENAIRVALAIGGSTNIVLHVLALIHDLELKLDIDIFNKLSDTTPFICSLIPSSDYTMTDFWRAGGVQVVMKELEHILNTDSLTVNGESIKSNLKKATNRNTDVIHPVNEAYNNKGGIAILRGNLAPDSGVAKPSAISKKCFSMSGPARVFDSEEELVRELDNNNIKEGDIIVIRFEGPRGGPGMKEMYMPLELIKGMGLEEKVAVITDGRFSGSNSGLFVGHICPEAAEGGPISIVEDGDIIQIDINKKHISVEITDIEIQNRKKDFVKPKNKTMKGYLGLYSKIVNPACKGAFVG
jgi:dihydroxy-acid dehydratase